MGLFGRNNNGPQQESNKQQEAIRKINEALGKLIEYLNKNNGIKDAIKKAEKNEGYNPDFVDNLMALGGIKLKNQKAELFNSGYIRSYNIILKSIIEFILNSSRETEQHAPSNYIVKFISDNVKDEINTLSDGVREKLTGDILKSSNSLYEFLSDKDKSERDRSTLSVIYGLLYPFSDNSKVRAEVILNVISDNEKNASQPTKTNAKTEPDTTQERLTPLEKLIPSEIRQKIESVVYGFGTKLEKEDRMWPELFDGDENILDRIKGEVFLRGKFILENGATLYTFRTQDNPRKVAYMLQDAIGMYRFAIGENLRPVSDVYMKIACKHEIAKALTGIKK